MFPVSKQKQRDMIQMFKKNGYCRSLLGGKCVQCDNVLWRKWSFEERQAADISVPGEVCQMNVCASCIFAEFDKERKFMWDESPSKKSFQPEGTDECGKCNKEVGYEEICNDNEETWRKSAGRKFIWKQDGRRQVVVFCKKCI